MVLNMAKVLPFMHNFKEIDNTVKRKYFICIRIVCFLSLCICIMYYLSNVFTIAQLEEYPTRNGFWQTVNAEDDNTIDMMFVGDSSVMHAINPMQIWRDSHITSFVMSYSVMKPQEAYFDLKKLFNKQSPKYVFMESQFLVTLEKDNFDYFINDTQNLVDFCNDEITGEIDYYLPVMKYKSAWKSTHFSDFTTKHPEAINSIYKGYKYSPEIQPFTGQHTSEAEGVAVYKYSGDKYFDKIYNLCKDNDCQLVLMTMPQGSVWNKKLHDKIEKLAEKYDVNYYDFDINLEKWIPDFSWNTDTKDGGGHLNYSGATKVTSVLSKDLISKLHIGESVLSDSQAKKWNDDMEAFYSIVNK